MAQNSAITISAKYDRLILQKMKKSGFGNIFSGAVYLDSFLVAARESQENCAVLYGLEQLQL
ncbi:MAG: hypothetical protein IJI41_12850 [Anaerolineaceae bacterium]|nr:hypothetical protein [Anaerolineaceae bacterium]